MTDLTRKTASITGFDGTFVKYLFNDALKFRLIIPQL